MSLGWIIMLIIIAIAAIVVALVFVFGIKHDPHTEMRSAESSKAVQMLNQQYDAAMRKLGVDAQPSTTDDSAPAADADAETAQASTQTLAENQG
mgnify:CR=1 FL=1